MEEMEDEAGKARPPPVVVDAVLGDDDLGRWEEVRVEVDLEEEAAEVDR